MRWALAPFVGSWRRAAKLVGLLLVLLLIDAWAWGFLAGPDVERHHVLRADLPALTAANGVYFGIADGKRSAAVYGTIDRALRAAEEEPDYRGGALPAIAGDAPSIDLTVWRDKLDTWTHNYLCRVEGWDRSSTSIRALVVAGVGDCGLAARIVARSPVLYRLPGWPGGLLLALLAIATLGGLGVLILVSWSMAEYNWLYTSRVFGD